MATNAPMITNRQSVIQIVRAASCDILSALSGDIFSFSLGLMLLHATHSAISFGLGSVIYPLIGLLFVIPISNLVDTHAHKPLILLSKTCALVVLMGYTLVLPHVNNKLWASVVMITVFGICDKLTNTGYTASVHELVNPEHIKPLNTIEQSAISGIQLFSPLLASLLYTLIGFAGVLKIEIVSEILVLVITASMHFFAQPRTTPVEPVHGQWAQFKVGLQYIRQHTVLLFIVQLAVGLNFLFSATDVGIPYALVQDLKLGNARLGLVMSGFALGMLGGNLLLMWLPEFKHLVKQILILTLCFGVMFLVAGGLLNAHLTPLIITGGLVLTSVIMGLLLAFINTPTSVYMQQSVPTELLGRVSGTMNTLDTLALPLGTLTYSWLFQILPAEPIFMVTGGLILALVAAFWRLGSTTDAGDGSVPMTKS